MYMFRSSHFSFLVFAHFWQRSYKNAKILHILCLHCVKQDGQDRKKRKENHKYLKPKTKLWDGRNILISNISQVAFRWIGQFRTISHKKYHTF